VAADAADARIQSYSRDDLRGKDDEELTCDVAVLGPETAERGAIVISGTHGAEGYCGSAILHRWLTDRRDRAAPDSVKVVLVHAINPWAFSHKTRTTENNVDLNRNFVATASGYNRSNPSYEALAPFLHPDGLSAPTELATYKAYRDYVDAHGWHIEGEAWAGQSHRPDGMYYTGRGPEWANGVFRRIVNEHLGAARSIGFIDWHTCIGAFGEIVYLVFDDEGTAERAAAMNWWGLTQGSEAAFRAGSVPKYEGLLCRAIRQELPDRRITGAVIEFGTVDDYSLFRADRVDRWLASGGRDDPERETLRDNYKDVCCPRDVAWRRFVLAEGPAIMDRMVDGVRDWTSDDAGPGAGPNIDAEALSPTLP
jgi:hypothetical protein